MQLVRDFWVVGITEMVTKKTLNLPGEHLTAEDAIQAAQAYIAESERFERWRQWTARQPREE